mmetsp:Transcript_14958/g.30213  ORF Transcript_14958/g.30213 Transcript_14958/m.30213 type:complete len:116 (-) Transcript_14958:411-758(-)
MHLSCTWEERREEERREKWGSPKGGTKERWGNYSFMCSLFAQFPPPELEIPPLLPSPVCLTHVPCVHLGGDQREKVIDVDHATPRACIGHRRLRLSPPTGCISLPLSHASDESSG